MADNSNSVGSIALDLVIKNQINAQLEAIMQSVSAPAQRVGNAVETAIERPLNSAASVLGDSIGNAAERASNSVQSAFDSIRSNTERLSESMNSISDINVHFHDDAANAAENIRSSLDSAIDEVSGRAQNITENMDGIVIHFSDDGVENSARNIRDTFSNAFSDVQSQAQSLSQLETDIGVNAEFPDFTVISQQADSAAQTVRDSFGNAFGDVRQQAAEAVNIRVDADTSAAGEQIRTLCEQAENAVNLQVNADIPDIGSQLDELRQQAESGVNVPINADVSNIDAQIENVRQQAENAVEIPVNIDVSNVASQLENIREQAENSIDIPINADAPDIGAQLENSVNSIDTSAIENRIESTMSNIRAMLGNAEISSDPTERLVRELELTEEKISVVHAKWQELQSSLAAADDADAAKIISGLDKAEADMLRLASTADRLRERLAGIAQEDISIDADITADTGALDEVGQAAERVRDSFNFKVPNGITAQLRQELELSRQKLEALQEKWRELSAAEPTETVTAQLRQVESQILSTQRHIDGLENKIASAGSTSSKTFSRILSAGKKAFTTLGKVGNKALDGIRQRFGFVGKTADAMARPVEKLGRTIKNTFRRVFITTTLFAAVRAIKKAFGEVLEQNEELSDSLNQVKANLAAAFMPILQTIMPALNTFMHGLAAVTKQVAGFISGIFDTTYAQSAKAAQKLKDTAKTAQDTAKKVKTAMAGIDEMNVLSAGSDSNSDDEREGIDWSKVDMSEPVLPDWAERLKNAVRSGDWQGIGEIFAERVNSVFSSVDWDRISSKVNSGVQNIVDVINGFVGEIDWELLGDSLAGGINTVVSAVNTFWDGADWDNLGTGIAKGLNQSVKKINWKALGKALTGKLKALIDFLYAFTKSFDFSALGTGIGDAVNGAFENIDFAKAGQTLSNSIKGLLDFLIGFVERVDWKSIGTKIYQFVSNIDFSGIADRIFELLGAAIGASASLLSGFAGDIVQKLREYFEEHFNKFDTGYLGLNIVLGLLDGILEGLVNIGVWIYDHVFKPFINGFKEAFDINSPSKVMAKMGGYIIDGLLGAITDGIISVKKLFEKMHKAITSVFDDIDKWFDRKFTEAWDKITAVFSGIGTWFSKRRNDVNGAFMNVGAWFSSRFTDAWNGIKKAFSGCKKFFDDRRDEIHDSFGGIGEWFGKKWDEVKEKFSSVKDFFKDKFQQGYDAVTNVWNGIGQFFWDIWETVSVRAKDGMNWLMGRIENGINNIIDGINWLSWDAPDWVREQFGIDHFGFNVGHVNLPRLANGGIATAPTLAMVGDNKNASVDPEVISPLSKLQGMIGTDPQVVELLTLIYELLKNGMNIEIINYLFKNSREFSREVLNVISENNARRGM